MHVLADTAYHIIIFIYIIFTITVWIIKALIFKDYMMQSYNIVSEVISREISLDVTPVGTLPYYLPIIELYLFVRYQAKVVRINESASKVLVHFEGWNSRHDTWFAFDSTSLRPLHLFETSQEQSSKRKV